MIIGWSNICLVVVGIVAGFDECGMRKLLFPLSLFSLPVDVIRYGILSQQSPIEVVLIDGGDTIRNGDSPSPSSDDDDE